MIDLGNRFIADDGTVILLTEGAVEAMYAGSDLADCIIEPSEDTDLYAHSLRLLDLDIADLAVSADQLPAIDWYDSWSTPEPFRSIDVLGYCLARCVTDDQRQRVCEELLLFEQRDMLPVLCHLIYMVDHLRSQNVVWGVGRGSSVSSYVLFLIGINRIDPLKFDLDVSEFLK